jgi:formate hydrogenlyase transcriptional activator
VRNRVRAPWPDNIRELQDVIERAVVSTIGRALRLPNAEAEVPPSIISVLTLADAKRAHILAALRDTNGVGGGWNGAAARLGVSRTSLIAKMQRLGLARA